MVDTKGKWAQESMSGEGYKTGEEVWVFYKFQLGLQGHNNDLWFPTETPLGGHRSPVYGWSDSWMRATICRDWRPQDFDEDCFTQFTQEARTGSSTGITVRYCHPYWFERDSSQMHPMSPLTIQDVHPAQVRRSKPPPVDVSFLVFRWGGYEQCDPVMNGDGGWGNAGSATSDRYMITIFENVIWPSLGPTYEVLTVFIKSGKDLEKIHAPLFNGKMKGRHKVGMYFLWPVDFEDNPTAAGYVSKDALLATMESFEACGVVSRFPHHSPLYKTLLSKDWMAQLCLMQGMRVPVSTKIPRSLIVADPLQAAQQALETMRHLHNARETLQPNDKFTSLPENDDKIVGIAKCGYSWEAMDVCKFIGQHKLAEQLTYLVEQRYSLVPHVIVQEYIKHDIEFRLFYTNIGRTWDLKSKSFRKRKADKILYTKFEAVDENGKMREFVRMDRQECMMRMFNGDAAALKDAEDKAYDLAARIFLWLSCDCSEPPPVMRLDFMVRHAGAGVADVYTGEITELGASFLGWDEAPEIVFGAMLQSCFSNKCQVEACRCGGGGYNAAFGFDESTDYRKWNYPCNNVAWNSWSPQDQGQGGGVRHQGDGTHRRYDDTEMSTGGGDPHTDSRGSGATQPPPPGSSANNEKKVAAQSQ